MSENFEHGLRASVNTLDDYAGDDIHSYIGEILDGNPMYCGSLPLPIRIQANKILRGRSLYSYGMKKNRSYAGEVTKKTRAAISI